MKKDLLPIGSVVLLEGGTKTLMITGYKMKEKPEDTKVYDYVACPFPEGFMEQIYSLFDGSQIKDVLFVGYQNDEFDNYDPITISNGFGTSLDGHVGNVKLPLNSRRGRKPKAPTKPMSKSEMLSKYGVQQLSDIGEDVEGDFYDER